MNKLLITCLSFFMYQASFAQCTPDPNVPAKSFKVSDTCAIKGASFNSIITINIPDTIDVPPVKVIVDSMLVKNIVLGTGTGINVTYNNGNKKILPKVLYCATIGGPTVTGAKGIYSTNATGVNKISFSADIYRNGSVVLPIDETILVQAGLEIRFKIVDNVGECATFSSIKQMYLEDIQQLQVEQAKTSRSIQVHFSSAKNEQYQISCIDLNGKTIAQQSIEASVGKNDCTLQTSAIQAGLYFIEISDGVGKQVMKFIVE